MKKCWLEIIREAIVFGLFLYGMVFMILSMR